MSPVPLALDQLRELALALPDVNERVSHGAPCFFIGDQIAVCYFHDSNHRGDGRVSLWCPAPPGVQAEMVATEPGRFFAPPNSANGTFSDWLGLFLDTDGDDTVDWDEVAVLLDDAYRTVAPGRSQRLRPTDGPYQFQAPLWMHSGETAWYFLTVPVDLSEEIEELMAATRRGFGSVRVEVTIGSTTWNTSVFPDKSSRCYVLPIKKQVRTKEKLEVGTIAEVSLSVVDAPGPPD